MEISVRVSQFFRRSVGVVMAATVCSSMFTVQAQDRNEKLRRFDADRRDCLSGKTNQTFDSCMKEAKAVFVEQPDSNPPISAEQLQRNAQLRCEPLTGDDRAACMARMRGEGTVSGDVAGGGILRELITIEVAPANPQRPASAGVTK